MSGSEWRVKHGENSVYLKSSKEADPFLPPTTGWLFYNWKTKDFEEGPSVTCSLPSSSPPCCLTVPLSEAAKEAHGDCEGEYKSTGLISMGRPVNIFGQYCIKISISYSRFSSWRALRANISS